MAKISAHLVQESLRTTQLNALNQKLAFLDVKTYFTATSPLHEPYSIARLFSNAQCYSAQNWAKTDKNKTDLALDNCVLSLLT